MSDKVIVGWKEWASLPDLHIFNSRAKIDTGAKTSSIHAYDIQECDDSHVTFFVDTKSGSRVESHHCKAKVLDHRAVKSSMGHIQHRYVIESKLQIGTTTKSIALTLANRSKMRFKILIGREALNDDFLVDPGLAFVNGKH